MTVSEHLQRLFDHLAWANAEVARALRRGRGDDPRALEYYAHVLGAEHVWIARMRECPPAVAVWPALTLDECERLSRANDADFAVILSENDDQRVMRAVTYRNSAGQEFTSSLMDILTHVAMHGAYHRGQVSLMMRQGGAEPAATDFIAFARGAPAAKHTDAG